jgi:hypothetical protein
MEFEYPFRPWWLVYIVLDCSCSVLMVLLGGLILLISRQHELSMFGVL